MASQWPLTGRDGELAVMRAAVDDPAGGGIVVAGPQGMGRTRLASEIVDRARSAGRATAWATATRSAGAVGFGALAHLLPDDVASLASDRPVEVLRRADAVVARLAAGSPTPAGAGDRPVPPLLVVDDAHLLDDPSAAFVHHVALRRLATLVVTVRSDTTRSDSIGALWKDGLLARCDLAPLPRSATAALLARALGGQLDVRSVHRLQQVTAGGPLFLHEVVHAALDDGSLARRRGLWQWDGTLPLHDRLVELTDARVAAADPLCRPALELVALGEPLPVWLAERLAGQASVEAAERAGLLESVPSSASTGTSGETVRFRQPIHRAVLRSAIASGRRRVLCQRLADELCARRGGRGADLLPIAVWLLQAGCPPDRRTVSFTAAARLALQADDPTLAERLARAALDGHEVDALAVLADALEKQGHHDQVVRLLATSPTSPVTLASDEPVALAVARASNRYWAGNDTPSAPASAPAAGSDGVGSGGEVAATDAWIQFFDSRLAECLDTATGVLARLDATAQARVWASTAATAALGLSGRSGEALAVADVGLAAARVLGPPHPWSAPQVTWARALALVVAGRVAEAQATIEPEDGGPADTGDGSAQLVGMWLGFRGLVARTQGDNRTARSTLHEAVTLLDRDDMYQFARLWLAELAATLACCGDADGARAVFDDAVERDTGANRVFDPWIALDGAWVCASEGRLSDAVDIALQAADLADALGQRGFEVRAAFDVARLGRPELVEERLAVLAQRTDGRLTPTCRDAARALATRDAAGLDDAARRFEAFRHDLIAAEMASAAHAQRRAGGEPTMAGRAGERARRLRSLCPGATTPLLDLAEDQLVLTHREREIAALAAAGRSSPEIARVLHISARTVDNHLGRTYAKLGITGRADLAAVFDAPP